MFARLPVHGIDAPSKAVVDTLLAAGAEAAVTICQGPDGRWEIMLIFDAPEQATICLSSGATGLGAGYERVDDADAALAEARRQGPPQPFRLSDEDLAALTAAAAS